ncbi:MULTISPECIES: nucleoside triphosphate pyrophosphohydrolase [Prochlorococcus]|uniref:Predicted pyrophosphatase n=2 Tax=Prochlorococcus marinus TaxID=1219 RepID=Q7V9I6_PROMA|nr:MULTISPECIES: nucleoside triphosphate pyrophosphohydrolase [Prochlorococcus]AAQ00891.1 Predicted pyrophosphatase [Prochlorococcus marinus subsp. marinus str. CCMP1375]KGG10615.1 Nucleoside triphosphate pyrophosphohydrolase MazG [Prochlorococcus marinus str. LG]KGG31879.1 Nucleoside triphosphate pyrophosphohydrolase MazG [Prochlorococcus marinus str. SS51]KGG35956.1 Nucleoside triphosphate pyrophosphohydrolase MazG [Prochlorococcus sp. SS52]
MLNLRKSNPKSAIEELIRVVSKLRNPINGCPWDLKQNHTSLIPYAIEEAYEVCDAIRYGNDSDLIEELGDLLLQVVLHAQIANEEKRFCFDDIAQTAAEKMIRRHPHVFHKKREMKEEEIQHTWEEIKQLEKPMPDTNIPFSQGLIRKVRSQSALTSAIYISKKTSEKGLERHSLEEAWKSVEEDIKSCKNDLSGINNSEGNIGRLLLNIINIGIIKKLNPEEGLLKANKEFLCNLSYIEAKLNNTVASKLQIKNLWKEAKMNNMKDTASVNYLQT